MYSLLIKYFKVILFYKNLTNKSIKSITIDIKVFDKQNNEIKPVENFEYKNLIAGADATFGEKNLFSCRIIMHQAFM